MYPLGKLYGGCTLPVPDSRGRTLLRRTLPFQSRAPRGGRVQVTRGRVRLSGGKGPSHPSPLRLPVPFFARVQRRLPLHTPSFAHCASDSATTVSTLHSTSVCNPLAPSLSAARNQTRPPPPCTRLARRLPDLIHSALSLHGSTLGLSVRAHLQLVCAGGEGSGGRGPGLLLGLRALATRPHSFPPRICLRLCTQCAWH